MSSKFASKPSLFNAIRATLHGHGEVVGVMHVSSLVDAWWDPSFQCALPGHDLGRGAQCERDGNMT